MVCSYFSCRNYKCDLSKLPQTSERERLIMYAAENYEVLIFALTADVSVSDRHIQRNFVPSLSRFIQIIYYWGETKWAW